MATVPPPFQPFLAYPSLSESFCVAVAVAAASRARKREANVQDFPSPFDRFASRKIT